jgi:hypothetical protein
MTKTADGYSLRARTLIAIAGMALLFSAWRVLSLGLADQFALRDPEAALAWRNSLPAALLVLAGREGTAAADVQALAKRALSVDPLSGRGYRLLGESAVARGDVDAALPMYALAVSRGPRDLRAQGWLLEHHLRTGNIQAALVHLDIVLRIDPSRIAPAIPVLVAIAQAPGAQEALVARLQLQPPWRTTVLRQLATAATDVEAMIGLFERLRLAPGGISAGELEPWLLRLGQEGRWGQAYLIWASQLPPERLAGLGNVANGGFEFVPSQVGFDWRFHRISGARIDRVADAGGTGSRSLHIAFEDRRVPFANVLQLLALPPGDYRLSGQVRTENLRTERGLVWSVDCANPGGGRLTDSAPIRGHGGWREFSTDFTVPAGCGGQWLILRLPARIPAEQRIGGQVWFDDIRVRRRDATD